MMKLYFAPGACSLSPHIALREAGLPFDLEKVNLGSHKTASGEDFYTINPKGYVPALRLPNGEVLTEGPAIVQYLADQVPEKKLAPPAGSLERVRLQEWLNFISTEIHKTFGPLWDPQAPEASKEGARQRLAHRFAWLDQQLTGRNYLMQEFSVADGYLFTCLSWTRYLKLSLEAWPNLQAYLARIGERPAVQEAIQAEQS